MRGRLVGDLQIGVVDNTLTNPACRLAEATGRFKTPALDAFLDDLSTAHPAVATCVDDSATRAAARRQIGQPSFG